MSEPLQLAPPTLYTLFPECTTLEEKAFKFLELKYEHGSDRRCAKLLQIDHKTVKAINDFLKDTDVGIRFNAMLAEQTEDFYSKKNLTGLYEGFQKDIARVEQLIKIELARVEDIDMKLVKQLIAEKRMWMTKLLYASLACRPIVGELKKAVVDDKTKTLLDQYRDLLSDGGVGDTYIPKSAEITN